MGKRAKTRIYFYKDFFGISMGHHMGAIKVIDEEAKSVLINVSDLEMTREAYEVLSSMSPASDNQSGQLVAEMDDEQGPLFGWVMTSPDMVIFRDGMLPTYRWDPSILSIAITELEIPEDFIKIVDNLVIIPSSVDEQGNFKAESSLRYKLTFTRVQYNHIVTVGKTWTSLNASATEQDWFISGLLALLPGFPDLKPEVAIISDKEVEVYTDITDNKIAGQIDLAITMMFDLY